MQQAIFERDGFSMRKLTSFGFLFLFAGLVACVSAKPAQAAFLLPGTWTVGDANTTSQTWTADPLLGVPAGWVQNNLSQGSSNPGPDPTLAVTGAFNASSGGYYSFSGNYQTTATIENHTGGAGVGTHVIVQYASTATDPEYHESGAYGTSIGIIRPSIQIVDASNNPLVGGAAPLAFEQTYYDPAYSSSFGIVPYEELMFEFFLPDFTGDFQVIGSNLIHSSFQSMRVDSALGNTAYALTAQAVPEPSTMILLGSLAITGVWNWKKRRKLA